MKIETDTLLSPGQSDSQQPKKGKSCGLFSIGVCTQKRHWVENEEVHLSKVLQRHWAGLF